MKLVDANVLLYAVNTDAHHHRVAREWLDGALNAAVPVAFSWLVLVAFVRVSTQGSLLPRPLTTDEATEVVQAWVRQPCALLIEPTVRHLDIWRGLLATSGGMGNLVNDAHLAALSIEYGADVVSFDADFGRWPGVRWQLPGLSS